MQSSPIAATRSSLDILPADDRALLRPAAAPRHAAAMKAVLTDERFSDDGWLFERKLDGVRCIAIRDGGPVKLLSRNDLSLNERYSEVAQALDAQPQQRFAVDGEVVAFDRGQTSFAKLAQRGRTHVPVFYYIFDVLWLDGHDVRALPLRSRKRLLRDVLHFEAKPLRFSNHRNRDGEAFFREACRKGWEGLIAKRADSPYTDKRSRDWLKLKCEQGQELVIGGYTAPKGSRTDFGALLLGYYDGSGLRYAGKVGTGFDEQTLHSLGEKLRSLRQDESPFADAVREGTAQWVRPELVAELGFSEWTTAGRLRHPRFLGLRDDKSAQEVVREAPARS